MRFGIVFQSYYVFCGHRHANEPNESERKPQDTYTYSLVNANLYECMCVCVPCYAERRHQTDGKMLKTHALKQQYTSSMQFTVSKHHMTMLLLHVKHELNLPVYIRQFENMVSLTYLW